MSQAPFSKPDVSDVVSSSYVFKIYSSLNHWSRGMLSESRDKHLFGIVVIALLLLGLQLTACGNAESPLGSTSPTSNSTSQSSTPTTTSSLVPGSTSTTGPTKNPTAGPTTGPTTVPTVVPTADPKSFTVTEANITYAFIGTAGQQATIDTNNSEFDQPYIDVTYGNPSNPTPAGPIDWSVVPSTDKGGNWLDLDPRGGSLKFGKPLRVNIKVSVPQGMLAGTYTGKIVFSPNTSGNNHDDVTLTVVPSGPTVSSINPTSGPAAGGTTVTITGTGFTNVTGVSFGSTAASGFTVDSDTQITATSPAGSGTVNVTVTTPNGTASAQFTYT
jgi:hypothetical protein